MRATLLCAGLIAALLTACPPASEEIDGGTADAASSDLGLADRGAVDAAAPDTSAVDTAGTDAGSEVDAAVGIDHAGGADAAEDDAGACANPDWNVCDGVPPSGNTYTLNTTAPGISGARSYSIGATRAAVTSATSGLTETPASFNAFAVIQCSEGLVLYFADNLDATNPADEGTLSDDDVLYKITALGDFDGATDTGTPLRLGDDSATATAALGAADFTGAGFTISGEAGEFRFLYSGVSALLSGGVVAAISVFAPQSPSGTIDAAIDLAAGTIGGVSLDHSFVGPLPVADGSTIAATRALFGASPEASGNTSVMVDTSSLDIVVLSYSALGVRFVGPAEQYSGLPPTAVTGDDRRLYTAVITTPFQGDDSGVGIGTARAEVEALLGTPYAWETDANGLTLFKYDASGRNAGVVYAQDSDCVERAALLFVNLIGDD